MVDHGLTKGVILCPTKKTIDAAGVASLFFSKVFKRFSLYDKIISDRGPQFTSTFVMVIDAPTSFSPFSLTDCTLYSHFSFDDFIMIAFLDLTRDLDNQI